MTIGGNMPYSQSVGVRCNLEEVKLIIGSIQTFIDWLGVSVMFDTSCPSRDDPLKEYSILFSNKLNTHEFLYCAMKKYGSVHLSWNMRRSTSIFLCFNTSISNSTRSTENNRFYGRKTDSSKSARSRHYYLAKSARFRHYHLASDHNGMNDRQIYDCIANQYPQSIVRSRECCRGENERCLWRSSLVDEVVNNLGLI